MWLGCHLQGQVQVIADRRGEGLELLGAVDEDADRHGGFLKNLRIF